MRLIFVILMISVSVCHGRIWQEDFDSAYATVKKSNNLLLVGFIVPGNQRSEQLAYSLEQLLKIPYMNEHCDVVYSNMLTSSEIAQGMKVFRVGTLLTLLPNGKQLGRLNDPLPLDQLKAYMDGLLPALNKYVTADSQQTTLPLTLREGFVHGDLLYGPVSIPATNNEPVEIGVLESGKVYLVVVSGQYSVWPDVKKHGVDAVWYGHPKNLARKPPVRTKTLKLLSHKVNFTDVVKDQSGGPAPMQPEHVYEIMIAGTGEPLTMAITDQSPHDNSGELYVTVYARK